MPRRPVARSRRCAAGPGSSRRVRASSRARPTSTTPAWPRPPARPGGWQAVEWDLVGPFGIDAPGAWTAARGHGGQGRRGHQGRRRRHRRGLLQPAPVPPLAGPAGQAHARRLRLRRARPLPQRPQRARDVRRQCDRRGRRQPLRHDRGRLPGGHHARARPRLPRRGDLVGHRARHPLLRGPRRAGDQPLGRVLRPAQRAAVHDHELARRARRDPLRRRAPGARRGRRGQLRRGRDPVDGARRLDRLRRGHDRARLPGRLLELRPRRRRRRARAAAATPRCPTTPTARPTPRRGATSSRSASSTASTATSRSRTIAAGASG